MKLNDVTEPIIGAAIDVHRELGPGLPESTYDARLRFDLAGRGLRVEPQKGLPVGDRDVRFDCGDRIDLLVENRIIVELKAVAPLDPIHEAELLSYLRLSGCHGGLSIDFNVNLLGNGIRRPVNELKE